MNTFTSHNTMDHKMTCKRCVRPVFPAQLIQVEGDQIIHLENFTIKPCLCGGKEIYIQPATAEPTQKG